MAKAKRRAMTPEEQTKVIIVEFEDGPRDGVVLRNDENDPEQVDQAVHAYLVDADGGTLGTQYRTESAATLDGPSDVYEVVDRQEDESTIRVRFQYMGSDE